jgi:hypothetical protein
MAAYAATPSEPDVRDALALNAWEENRHKEVLSRMVAHSASRLRAKHRMSIPAMRNGLTWSQVTASVSAAFLLSARSRSAAARLSWSGPSSRSRKRNAAISCSLQGAAWHRAKLSWWRRIRFELKVAGMWAFLIWERMNFARTLDAEGNENKQDNNFTVNGTRSLSSVHIGVRERMTLCLSENERRFSGYDRRLLRPETTPKLVRFCTAFHTCREEQVAMRPETAWRIWAI